MDETNKVGTSKHQIEDWPRRAERELHDSDSAHVPARIVPLEPQFVAAPEIPLV